MHAVKRLGYSRHEMKDWFSLITREHDSLGLQKQHNMHITLLRTFMVFWGLWLRFWNISWVSLKPLTLPNPILFNAARSSMRLWKRLRGGSDASSGGFIFLALAVLAPWWFFIFIFLLNLGSTAPNYPRRPLMRSRKAPPNKKIGGIFAPTHPNHRIGAALNSTPELRPLGRLMLGCLKLQRCSLPSRDQLSQHSCTCHKAMWAFHGHLFVKPNSYIWVVWLGVDLRTDTNANDMEASIVERVHSIAH